MALRILRRPKATRDAEEIADYIASDSLDVPVEDVYTRAEERIRQIERGER